MDTEGQYAKKGEEERRERKTNKEKGAAEDKLLYSSLARDVSVHTEELAPHSRGNREPASVAHCVATEDTRQNTNTQTGRPGRAQTSNKREIEIHKKSTRGELFLLKVITPSGVAPKKRNGQAPDKEDREDEEEHEGEQEEEDEEEEEEDNHDENERNFCGC